MWLIKFRFGCVVIEQRTAQDMTKPEIVANVIAKATMEVIQNYYNIYDQLRFDGVTFLWFDEKHYNAEGRLVRSIETKLEPDFYKEETK